MSEDLATKMERFKALGRSAFVLGYTGEVGKALVQELNKTNLFKRVVLIGRREVPLDVGPQFEQKVVDYDKLDNHQDVFKDVDVGFCCLGTTRGKSGVQGFIRVDRDYVLSAGQIAKSQGCKHFSLVSGQTANENSCLLYSRTKGEAEKGLRAMDFDRLSIYRPAFLLADRTESRPMEAVFKCLCAPLFYCFPTAFSIPIELVARAMINNAVTSTDSTYEVYENKDVHKLSETKTGCCK